MARQFSPTHFFRNVPKSSLARYFQEKHQVLLEVDFASLRKSEVDSILDAYRALPDEKLSVIEAECQDIESMACQGGITALTDEANFHLDSGFPEAIADIDGFHGKAIWSFLEHPKYWTGATLFLHSDQVAESHWKKRNNMPKVSPGVEPEDTQRLADAISDFFHHHEGRGRNCKVEVYRRHDREYFFAYPEDYAQSGVEWVRNTLASRSRHPAFEIIFVYNKSEGSLDIYAPRNTKYVNDLQEIFAETILGVEQLDEFAAENQVYILDELANPDFVFEYAPDSAIESIIVRKLRLSILNTKKQKITLETDTSKNPKAIYELLESLNLPKFHVTQAEIKVSFAPVGNNRGVSRVFKISYPNWCALKHEGNDLRIRQILANSGIEPIPFQQSAIDLV